MTNPTFRAGRRGAALIAATAVRGHVLEVTSAAYYTGKDPNMLTAQLHH